MRGIVISLVATLAAVSLLAYLLLGSQVSRTNSLGAIRVGCLLVDFVAFVTLVILLISYRKKLADVPAMRRFAIGVCVVNGLFLIIFLSGLFLFLFP